MKDLKEIVKEVLDKGYLMSLATYDTDGIWVCEVIYVPDDEFHLYWISKTETRHSIALISNPKVAGTITLTTKAGEDDIQLQIVGNVKKIEGDILELAKEHRLKRNKPLPKKEGEVLGSDHSWYVLKPERIELTHEPLFGWEKQTLML